MCRVLLPIEDRIPGQSSSQLGRKNWHDDTTGEEPRVRPCGMSYKCCRSSDTVVKTTNQTHTPASRFHPKSLGMTEEVMSKQTNKTNPTNL